MDEIKKFLNYYGDLLDADQSAFFGYAEDALGSEDYHLLVGMLKDSDVELRPKEIFTGYDDYKLTHNIEEFIIDNFCKDINDFNGFDIKDLHRGKEALLRRYDIYIVRRMSGQAKVDSADIRIDCFDDNGLMVPKSIKIRFYHNNMLLTTFIFSTTGVEELFHLFQVVPNYGIGFNKIEIEEAMSSFITNLKQVLDIS